MKRLKTNHHNINIETLNNNVEGVFAALVEDPSCVNSTNVWDEYPLQLAAKYDYIEIHVMIMGKKYINGRL